MPYDPSLPANHSPLSSAEMRGQLNGLQENIDALATARPTLEQVDAEVDARIGAALDADTPRQVNDVQALDLDISDPPTAAEVSAVKDKLNELIEALHRA